MATAAASTETQVCLQLSHRYRSYCRVFGSTGHSRVAMTQAGDTRSPISRMLEEDEDNTDVWRAKVQEILHFYPDCMRQADALRRVDVLGVAVYVA